MRKIRTEHDRERLRQLAVLGWMRGVAKNVVAMATASGRLAGAEVKVTTRQGRHMMWILDADDELHALFAWVETRLTSEVQCAEVAVNRDAWNNLGLPSVVVDELTNEMGVGRVGGSLFAVDQLARDTIGGMKPVWESRVMAPTPPVVVPATPVSVEPTAAKFMDASESQVEGGGGDASLGSPLGSDVLR